MKTLKSQIQLNLIKFKIFRCKRRKKKKKKKKEVIYCTYFYNRFEIYFMVSETLIIFCIKKQIL